MRNEQNGAFDLSWKLTRRSQHPAQKFLIAIVHSTLVVCPHAKRRIVLFLKALKEVPLPMNACLHKRADGGSATIPEATFEVAQMKYGT